MSEPKIAFDAARHCDAMAATMGLTITEAQRPGVLEFLAVAHRLSEIVSAALPDDASFEPAAVFRPGRPSDGEFA